MLPAASARTAYRTGFARCSRPKPMTDDRHAAVPTDRSRRPPRPPSSQAGEGKVRADDEALWAYLRSFTMARIGLKRSGASLATGPLLDFKLAHARARDAVHDELDEVQLSADLAAIGLNVIAAASAAEDRQRYLMRPDLGRKLAPGDEARLATHTGRHDVVF